MYVAATEQGKEAEVLEGGSVFIADGIINMEENSITTEVLGWVARNCFMEVLLELSTLRKICAHFNIAY